MQTSGRIWIHVKDGYGDTGSVDNEERPFSQQSECWLQGKIPASVKWDGIGICVFTAVRVVEHLFYGVLFAILARTASAGFQSTIDRAMLVFG